MRSPYAEFVLNNIIEMALKGTEIVFVLNEALLYLTSQLQWRRKLIKSGAAILSMVIKSGAAQQPHWP